MTVNLLLSNGHLSDVWSTCHPPESHIDSSQRQIDAQDAVTCNGITCDNPLNSFSAEKTFNGDVTRDQGKRLDYIMYRRGRGTESTVKAHECKVMAVDERVHVQTKEGKKECSLTDHFGVEGLFEFSHASTSSLVDPPISHTLIPPRPSPREVLTLTCAALTVYIRHSAQLSVRQLRLFGLAILSIPILGVAASFQPLKYLNWIFVLLGIGAGAGGATMLYTGFIGGRWEQSALKNAKRDMEVELGRLERRGE